MKKTDTVILSTVVAPDVAAEITTRALAQDVGKSEIIRGLVCAALKMKDLCLGWGKASKPHNGAKAKKAKPAKPAKPGKIKTAKPAKPAKPAKGKKKPVTISLKGKEGAGKTTLKVTQAKKAAAKKKPAKPTGSKGYAASADELSKEEADLKRREEQQANE